MVPVHVGVLEHAWRSFTTVDFLFVPFQGFSCRVEFLHVWNTKNLQLRQEYRNFITEHFHLFFLLTYAL
jgi:hypothetical protein